MCNLFLIFPWQPVVDVCQLPSTAKLAYLISALKVDVGATTRFAASLIRIKSPAGHAPNSRLRRVFQSGKLSAEKAE